MGEINVILFYKDEYLGYFQLLVFGLKNLLKSLPFVFELFYYFAVLKQQKTDRQTDGQNIKRETRALK